MSGVAPASGAAADRDRAAHLLAARWSIERLHRPEAPELVWLGYAKPEIAVFECLACGAGGAKQGVLRAEGRTLYLCAACASHQVHPLPVPAVAPSGLTRRYQLEYAPELPGMAALVAGAVAGRSPGRLLDLGCGLGFAVQMAARLPGWRATGLDPGPLATLGAQLLQADVRTGGAAALAVLEPPGRFEVVVCEGVLDRCTEPLALLQAARARAAPGARWLIATRDAAMLYAAHDAATIRMLAAPERVLIPSRIGLEKLLLRAGFADAVVVGEGGGTLRADRNRRARIPGVDDAAAEMLLDGYLAHCLATLPEDASARTGLLVRAFERAVNRGDWNAGRRLAALLAPALAAAGEAARAAAEQTSLDSLLRGAPVCAPSLLYHAGMLHLNGSGPSTQALLCFELAAALAGRAHALAPLLMPAEADRHWAARFHAGLVRARMGETEAAAAEFAALAAAGERGGAAADAWAARARRELATLAQAAAAKPPPGRRARKPARAAP